VGGVGSCLLFVLAASSAAAPASTAVAVTRVDVTLSDFAIRLSADRVPRGRVVFRIVNRGNVPHGFTIAGRQTGTLPHGRRASLSAVLSRPGRYRFASGQPGDAAVGMAGSFRVGVGGKARPLATSSLLRLSTIATGLGPLTFAVAPPGDPHRLFVVRQDGLVLLFKDGVKEDRPFPWMGHAPRSSPTGSATCGGSRSTPRRRRC
jgi:uncharacterized cupredoxin-like copper-binding protein